MEYAKVINFIFIRLSHGQLKTWKLNLKTTISNCHSQEKLLKMNNLLTEKIIEIDSNFEIDFRQFSEEELY